MRSDLAAVLEGCADELVTRVTGRLGARPEFLSEQVSLTAAVQACVLALRRADRAGDAGLLAAAALAFGQTDPKPARGYRRAQLLLEALCAELVELVRTGLPRGEWREAMGRLRSLIGPAQVGLAAMFGSESAAPVEG